MIHSEYRFSLDIQIHQAQVSVPVSLNETARKLYISLTDGRKPYTIDAGCIASFVAKKPDGTKLHNHCVIERNTIIYEFTPQTTSVEGIVNCEIRLQRGDELLVSPKFTIVVDNQVVRDEEIELSADEHTSITYLINAEEARQNKFETDEVARQAAFESAEVARTVAETARAGAETTRQHTFESAETARSARLEELATIQKKYVFGGDFSGSAYTAISCNIPVGTYDLHIDNFESSDTDDAMSLVQFVGGDVLVTHVSVHRNTPFNLELNFSSPIDTVRLYASTTYDASVGDTFIVSGLKIIGDTFLNKRISDIEESIITFNPDILISRIEQSMLISNRWSTTVGEKIHKIRETESRGCCNRLIKVPVPIKITASEGFQFVVSYIDDNDIVTGESLWKTSLVIPANQRFSFSIWKPDGDFLTEETLKSAVTLKFIESERDNNDISNSLYVEYGRHDGATYNFVRIPKISNNGKTIKPVVSLTSTDGSLDGAKCSTLTYSKRNNLQFVINGGLFDVKTLKPIGQTIIGGVSVVNEPHPQGANGETISDTECYPLCIDANGTLSAPYNRYVDTSVMLADGVVHAVSGWGKLVDNFKIAQDDIDAEFVHKNKNYSRQCIGQFENGDYCVLTAWGGGYSTNYQNEAGLTYEECAQILVDHGVKFAYSLDGGGSAQTVIKRRQINPIYEGTEGRSVPAVIYFDINEKE